MRTRGLQKMDMRRITSVQELHTGTSAEFILRLMHGAGEVMHHFRSPTDADRQKWLQVCSLACETYIHTMGFVDSHADADVDADSIAVVA